MDVSIIIVTYNSAQHISMCLSSLTSHATNLNYEIIVIDNASTDQTIELVSAFKQVSLLSNPVNAGFAKANNMGVNHAQGQYLLFLNPDVIVTDYFMDKLVTQLEGHPERGIVAPKLIYSNGRVQESARRFPNVWVQTIGRLPLIRKWFHRSHDRYLMKDWDHRTHRVVDWVIGAALLCEKELFLQLGGFDESYFLYCEDMDLCYRCKKQGFSTYYVADVVLTHEYQQQSSRRFSKQTFMHLKSLFRFYRKYPELLFRNVGRE